MIENDKSQEQKNVCVKTQTFASYADARKIRDDERLLIERGGSTFSKAKIVRRGSRTSSSGQLFELKLYEQIDRPDAKTSKKKRQKGKKKG